LSGDSVHQELLPLPQLEGSVNQELLQFPKRLDQDGDQLTQQNINSSSVVFGDQNQGVVANDLATQNSTEHPKQVTFVLPQGLKFPDSSDAPPIIKQGPAVVPMASNPSEPRNDGIPTTNPEERKPQLQNPQGKPEKNLGCFNGVFFRTLDRFRSKSSSRPNCNFLKPHFASCLGILRSRAGSASRK
jgi:hypothetical protein